jgi:hypothetical protein
MNLQILILAICGFALAGCQQNRDDLLFLDSNLLGVQATAGGAEGATAKLGYSSTSVAKVPIVARDDDGRATALLADQGPGFTGTYSVLAQFDSQSTGQDVGLGRFFATGFAARVLAEGWADKLAK